MTGTPEPSDFESARPFLRWVDRYFEAGWYPFPLPPNKKAPPPSGSTGFQNEVSREEWKAKLDGWKRVAKNAKRGDVRAASNVGLRIPRGMLAIDVDAYKASGAESLARLEEDYGPLPATWTVTARSDGASGIRIYRLRPGEEDLKWPGKLGEGIETLHWGHRYAVAYPSVHPALKEPYCWYPPGVEPNGSDYEVTVPSVTDCELLPKAWVDAITSGRIHEHVPKKKLERGESDEWLDGERNQLDPCKMTETMLEKAKEAVKEDGAHDSMAGWSWCIAMLAKEGHAGVGSALRELGEFFLDEVTDESRSGDTRSEDDAVREYRRAIRGAVAAAIAEEESIGLEGYEVPEECPCWKGDVDAGGASLKPRGGSRAPDEYDKNDDGNAEMLFDMYGDRMRFVPGWSNVWVICDEVGFWRVATNGQAMELARTVGKRVTAHGAAYMKAAKQQSLSDDDRENAMKKGVSLLKWGEQCGNRSRLVAMLEVLTSYEGISVDAAKFDADPGLLCFGDQVVGLTRDGATVRALSPDDYCSTRTSAPYVAWPDLGKYRTEAGATGSSGVAVLKNYLDTFLPHTGVGYGEGDEHECDECDGDTGSSDLRKFVQKLCGYFLYGANPERVITFFQGPTGSGKSTLLEAMLSALGDYARTMPLHMLREKVDGGPSAEMVASLPKRLVVASEAGQENHLHAETLKRLGSEDTISARGMYAKVDVQRRPAFTIAIATNSAPTIKGADEALWARIIAVPFDYQVTDSGKRQIKHTLADVLRTKEECQIAILSWMVEGWNLYAREGLAKPARVIARGKDFRKGVNTFNVWFHGRYERDLSEVGKGKGIRRGSLLHRLPAEQLYAEYDEWCQATGIKIQDHLSVHQFYAKLRQEGFEVKKGRMVGASQESGTALMAFGVKRIEDADEEMSDIAKARINANKR